MQPLATDPDEAFLERTIRGLLVALTIFGLGLFVLYVLADSLWRYAQPTLFLLGLALATIALQRRRLLQASWLIVGVSCWMALSSIVQIGYWATGAYIGSFLMVVTGAILLPKSHARWIPYLTIFGYMLAVIIQYSAGVYPPSAAMIIDRRPINAVTYMIVVVAAIWTGVNYLMAELQHRRAKLAALTDALDGRVQARARILETAVGISQAFAMEHSLPAMMQQMVDTTSRAFRLFQVSIYRYDPQDEVLIYAAGSQVDEGIVPASVAAAVAVARLSVHSDSRLSQVARTRQPIIVNDLTSPQHRLLGALPEMRATMIAPLVNKNELVGVLVLLAQETNYFGPDEVRVFTLLAQNLAASMQSAMLFAAQVEANKQLRSLDEMKSQFLTTVSHELQTPLSLSLNFTEFVASGLLGPVNERQHDALNKAIDNGNLLLHQIRDLLDMSRLKSGMLRINLEERINLNEALVDIGMVVRALLKDKPVVFVEDIDQDLPLVAGEQRRIYQIFLNLLSNAAKFTEVGSITLSVKAQPGSVLIAVIDTGPGIAQEALERIWEPFQQAEAGLRYKTGTGLGLSITRGLVDAYGGKLWAESTPGQGSSFYVSLPAAAPVAPGSTPPVSHSVT